MHSIDVDALLESGLVAQVEHHATIDSTNNRARELAADCATRLPALVIADQQISGRGRGTNRWWTGQGSLAFSLLIDPAARGIERRLAPQLSLAGAVAVIDAVRPHAPHVQFGMHWPNDVFAAGRKLAGILVEALADGRLVLGTGINTNNTLADAPPELRPLAITLRDLTGEAVDHTRLLVRLLERLAEHLDALAASPTGLAARYEELCLQRDRQLTIEVADRRTTGKCRGIAPDGALLLEVAGQEQRFYGGVLRPSA